MSTTTAFLRISLIFTLLCLMGTCVWADNPQIPKSNVEEMGVVKKTHTPEAYEKADCVADEGAFCFLSNRFEVRVTWKNFASETGTGHVVEQPVSDNSGVFWFFTDGNWEMLVKVLDGCGLNDRYWVFSAATTNVEYTLTVKDTETGEEVSYTNPLGNAAAALTDTDALETCS